MLERFRDLGAPTRLAGFKGGDVVRTAPFPVEVAR